MHECAQKMHQNAGIGDRQEGKAARAAAAFRSCRPIIFINTVFRHFKIYCYNKIDLCGHLCRSLQRSAKMGQIARFPSRSGCKDGRVHTGGISIIYLQCGRVHLCSFLMLFSYCFLGLRRLCGVFASFFAHLCLRIKRSFSKGNFD